MKSFAIYLWKECHLTPGNCSVWSISVQTSGYSPTFPGCKSLQLHQGPSTFLPCCPVKHAQAILLILSGSSFFWQNKTKNWGPFHMQPPHWNNLQVLNYSNEKMGAARLCFCPQVTLAQFGARVIREKAPYSNLLLLFPSTSAILSHPKKQGREVHFAQNGPSVYKQDTPVLLAQPLLLKSFFNFTAEWYNKNSCTGLSYILP